MFLTACSNDDDNDTPLLPPTPETILGCTDNNALNFESSANKEDGSCQYSKVTFFARFNAFNSVPIIKIEILVDGEIIGSIDNGFIWPNAPGNCSANGTVTYTFPNRNSIDWNTNMFLASGQLLSTSGTRKPSKSIECIKINVTN